MRSLIRVIFSIGLTASIFQGGDFESGLGKVCGEIKNTTFKPCNPGKTWNPWDSSKSSKKFGEGLRKALIKPRHSHPNETKPVQNQKENPRNSSFWETQ